MEESFGELKLYLLKKLYEIIGKNQGDEGIDFAKLLEITGLNAWKLRELLDILLSRGAIYELEAQKFKKL